MSNAAAIALLARLAKIAIRKACETDERDRAEWRGRWNVTPWGKQNGVDLWKVVNGQHDPLHLHVYRSGMDYMGLQPYPAELISDGGSIPKALHGVKQLHLKPADFMRSYGGMHDPIYDSGHVYVRDPRVTMEWTRISATREDADLLLFLGLTCDMREDGATPSIADCLVIYRAVQIGAGPAWERHRAKDKKG